MQVRLLHRRPPHRPPVAKHIALAGIWLTAHAMDNENGARMAIDELNAKGVTIGGNKVRFELLAEDDGTDPKQGTAAAQ